MNKLPFPYTHADSGVFDNITTNELTGLTLRSDLWRIYLAVPMYVYLSANVVHDEILKDNIEGYFKDLFFRIESQENFVTADAMLAMFPAIIFMDFEVRKKYSSIAVSCISDLREDAIREMAVILYDSIFRGVFSKLSFVNERSLRLPSKSVVNAVNNDDHIFTRRTALKLIKRFHSDRERLRSGGAIQHAKAKLLYPWMDIAVCLMRLDVNGENIDSRQWIYGVLASS